jgi:hypothetical protein
MHHRMLTSYSSMLFYSIHHRKTPTANRQTFPNKMHSDHVDIIVVCRLTCRNLGVVGADVYAGAGAQSCVGLEFSNGARELHQLRPCRPPLTAAARARDLE